AREWLAVVRGTGELRDIKGASWQADIGAITAMLDTEEGSPAVLFDEIPGYAAGRRVLVNANGTPRRQAVTLGLAESDANHDGLFRFWREVLADLRPIAPKEVPDGPIFENVLEGDAVDLEAFPAPVWHPQDGGRYIGTASLNILRDPDSEWVNLGTYRNQVFAKDRLGIFIAPGKHGRLIRDRYLAKGERCPIVVVVGADPLLFMAACAEGIAYGQGELDWAGGVRGSAFEVVPGRHTGLPIPANAEIAIEGWIDPTERHDEGPYGEWTGYYSIAAGTTPVIHVEAIYHRNDPILLGCPQGRPPHEDNRFLAYLKSALVERQLKGAGVPQVTGVWCPPEGGNRLLVVVAIEQSYPGHATQAGLVAGQVGSAAYGGRIVVVVDADVDITSMDDVLWAVMTRCDPQRDVQIVKRAWSGPVDSAVDPDVRPFNSRLIIDATRPWEWRDRFPEPVITPAMARATRERWGWILERGDATDA
ncbi:MAG: UbiD family decarboxylase, partial [Candidatus Limnocylindrales bacterium]